jgi:hypothetical protein
MIHPPNLNANDAFQRLEHCTRPKSIHRVGPLRPFPQVHRIVISVGEPEANRYPSGGLEAQRVDQLFAKESHRRRTQDDDPLIVQADNPLIRTEIEQFCEVQVLVIGRFVTAGLRLHDTPILRLNRESRRIRERIRELVGVSERRCRRASQSLRADPE